MNDNFDTFASFIEALSTETDTNIETATKIANWLKTEGVLDFPVINETYLAV